MLFDLTKNETPHIGVRIEDKVYQIYANDKTNVLIDGVVGNYFEQADKLDQLKKKIEDAENGKTKIVKKDITDFSDDIVKNLREELIKLFDELLNEPGVGKRLWEAKHGSTDLLMTDLQTIQEALRNEKSAYQKRREQLLKEKYPIKNVKKRQNAPKK